MLAVLTVLFTVPAGAQVTICTDSVATIDGMTQIKDFSNLSCRKKAKIPNFTIWMTIAHVIDVLQLTVTMKKVKAHSGMRLNDAADKLAKAAACSAP